MTQECRDFLVGSNEVVNRKNLVEPLVELKLTIVLGSTYSIKVSLPGPPDWVQSLLERLCPVQEEQNWKKEPILHFEAPLVKSSRLSLQTLAPSLCPEGVGGTYFIPGCDGKPISIFKPVDEEPGAPFNPKKLVEKPLLPPGGGAIRELAAFFLDQSFAGVPETHLMHACHPSFSGSHIKFGSLQRYVRNMGTSASRGASHFLVEDVHRIGILDIRLYNLDRTCDNMLVVKDENADVLRLVPIDHTYCLPESLGDAFYDWHYWKQASQPFSQESLAYIESLDIERDAALLRNLDQLSEKSIDIMKLMTCILKKGAAAGLVLSQIASLISRRIPSELSPLEILIAQKYNNVGFGSTFELISSELILQGT